MKTKRGTHRGASHPIRSPMEPLAPLQIYNQLSHSPPCTPPKKPGLSGWIGWRPTDQPTYTTPAGVSDGVRRSSLVVVACNSASERANASGLELAYDIADRGVTASKQSNH